MITKYAVNLEMEQPKTANVASKYRDWTLAEVRADLDNHRTDLVSICMNLDKCFNKASVIRANNAFSGKEVYIVGAKHYDARGTVGTKHYEHVYHADNLAEVVEKLREDGYTIFAVDNNVEIDGFTPENVWDVDFPVKSAFLYGEEQRGLQEEEIRQCDRMVFLNQTGSVRSLNIAQAAACVMSEYSRQHRM